MPIKTLTLGGLQSCNGKLESRNDDRDEKHPGNSTHRGGGVLAKCAYCREPRERKEVQSMFGLRTNILIARSI